MLDINILFGCTIFLLIVLIYYWLIDKFDNSSSKKTIHQKQKPLNLKNQANQEKTKPIVGTYHDA